MPTGLDAYVRVSRVGGREGDSYISPNVQLEQITRWADLRDVKILARHVDEDVSGSTVKRAGLDEALRRVEGGLSKGIVVARLDRFARTLAGALEVIEHVEKAGGQIVSVADNFDATTPTGKMQQQLLLVLAQWELARLREGWGIARSRAIERGVHISGRVPAGYVRGDDGRLQLDPDHAEAIREAFHLRAAGASWANIARHLTARGVPVNTGGGEWRGKAVQFLIANRVYLGEARSGKLHNAKAHDPLVTREEFDAAQSAKSLPSARGEGQPALLSGLARCAGCRYRLYADTQVLANDERARAYRCGKQHKPGRCPAPATVSGRRLEPFVIAEFLEHLGDHEQRAARATQDVDRAQLEVADAEAELGDYLQSERIRTAAGPEAYEAGVEARAGRRDAALQRLDAAKLAAGPLPERAVLKDIWGDLTTAEQQTLLAAAVDCVFVRQGRGPIDDRAHICWRGEAPDDLPTRRGREVKPLSSFTW